MEKSSINKKKLSIVLLALLVTVTVLIGLFMSQTVQMKDNAAKLDAALEENNNLNSKIFELEKRNLEMESLLGKAQATLESRSEIESLSSEDQERIRKIMEMTPLDEQSAIAVVKYSRLLDIDPSLILSMIEKESTFNRYQVGNNDDRGYMQIIPGTEKALAGKYGSEYGLDYDPDRIFEPDYNIGLAAIYIDTLRDSYGEDYDKILTAYNRGKGGLKKYYSTYNTYESSYSREILKNEAKYTSIN